MALDPVCKMEVEEEQAAAISVYKGKTYHFCSPVCKERFEKDPAMFVTEEEGSGGGGGG